MKSGRPSKLRDRRHQGKHSTPTLKQDPLSASKSHGSKSLRVTSCNCFWSAGGPGCVREHLKQPRQWWRLAVDSSEGD
ncbi:hypothetical protein LDENG_00175950 [Lucifuga dentata]|nr:hypothetical protein LDENG_00175950 [Lucifuga dentata]